MQICNCMYDKSSNNFMIANNTTTNTEKVIVYSTIHVYIITIHIHNPTHVMYIMHMRGLSYYGCIP